jgi:hypothetical protein
VVRFQILSHLLGLAHALLPRRAGRDGLLEEDGDGREVLGELQLEVSGSLEPTPEGRGSRDKDRPGRSGRVKRERRGRQELGQGQAVKTYVGATSSPFWTFAANSPTLPRMTVFS